MFETLAYLLLSLWFLLLWAVAWFLRPDLRSRMGRASIFGGIAGVLAEIWYFRDYWRPPTVFGVGIPGPEDFIVGFAITGLSIAAYDVLFRTHNVVVHGTHPKWPFMVTLLIGLVLLSDVLGYNSCLVSEALFAVFALAILWKRPDLWKVSVVSGLATLLAALPAYLILFGWLLPDWWDTYWILENTFWRSLVIWHMPVSELLWYATWGCFAGIFQNYVHGTMKQPLSGSLQPTPLR